MNSPRALAATAASRKASNSRTTRMSKNSARPAASDGKGLELVAGIEDTQNATLELAALPHTGVFIGLRAQGSPIREAPR